MLASENGRYRIPCPSAVMPKANKQTWYEIRGQLSRCWAREKVKATRVLVGRADNNCATSQTGSDLRQRGFTLRHLLAGALTLFLTTWWAGFLNEYLWPPERVLLSIENLRGSPPPRPEHRFRVVLCWLDNDTSGDDTQIVEQAFQSVSGIELVRSALSVRASGAADDWRPAMQDAAAEVLAEWDADLAIVGLVKQTRQVLSLWFISRTGEGTLGRGDRPYKLEDVTLGEDFHEDLDDQLEGVLLAAMSITEDTDEMLAQALEQWLREVRGKLAARLRNSAESQPERRSRLQEVLGLVLLRLGELDGGTQYPEEAVSVYRASLKELSRDRAPLEWARMQYYLGTALYSLGKALSVKGERESGMERLEEAVEVHRAALEEFTRERAPLDWAFTQNNLGGALHQLGDQGGGTQRLEEAVKAYRAALEELTRERWPLQWASKQNNLGTVLRTLGMRVRDTERLQEAVEAHRAALEEYTRDRAPLEWALTQNNLGVALSDLGWLEGNTERLEEAVAAYESALRERTRERRPLEWARTQNNLGGALWILGQSGGDTKRLEEAVAAHRAALTEHSRERMPFQWAKMLTDLGTALSGLGRLEGDTERLEEAVAAYRGALEEYTRERAPLEWARTQNNLGSALWILGEMEGDTERLDQAVAAHESALEEYTQEQAPLEWAWTQMLLGTAYMFISVGQDDTSLLVRAVTAYRAALEDTRVRAPLDWAQTQNLLGLVLLDLGERTGDTERLEEAVEAHRAALEEFTREHVPEIWALTQNNLGNALRVLGERAGDMERLKEAVEAHRAALEEYTRERMPGFWALTQNNLGDALRILGESEVATIRLEEAAAAYRAALEEYSRQPHRVESARKIEDKLDDVLRRLNERQAKPADAAESWFGLGYSRRLVDVVLDVRASVDPVSW